MKESIKFKPSYLKKNIWVMIIICTALSLAIFIGLNVSLEYQYLFSMTFVFTGVLVVFYLNRFEPEYIIIDNEKLEIEYSNKSFFKKAGACYLKNALTILNDQSVIKIYHDNILIAVIRGESLDFKDLNVLSEWLK